MVLSHPCQTISDALSNRTTHRMFGRTDVARTWQARFIHQVKVTRCRIGPVCFAPVWLAAGQKDAAPWIVISDEPNNLITFDQYGFRFDIEGTSWTTNPMPSRCTRAKSAPRLPCLDCSWY